MLLLCNKLGVAALSIVRFARSEGIPPHSANSDRLLFLRKYQSTSLQKNEETSNLAR
jgi:hypothetical protein